MSSTDLAIQNTTFAKDIQEGLSKSPKELSSKYFYDAEGDRLFQEIMNMPEYYLTNAEFEILSTYKDEILQLMEGVPFEMLELGAGDGTKTKILLEHFLDQQADFRYRPIDISQNALDGLVGDLKKAWPSLNVSEVQGDYFKALNKMKLEASAVKLVLFMGATIGNFTRAEALQFLKKLREELNPSDYLLVGFDLKKNPQTILDAYNDPAGITASFNLNLLHRINRELEANFEVDQFQHWENYNPITGETKSYIVSKVEQEVHIAAIDQSFHFDAWEAIYVELSLKYSKEEIDQLASEAGFKVIRNFYDDKKYFADSLWQAK